MDYYINASEYPRQVIFNLPPPFSTLWCKDRTYQRAIELCFLCYLRSGDNWLVDIESVLYEHMDAELMDETSTDDYNERLMTDINNILHRIHQHHDRYTEAVQAVLGYFNPELYDYIEVICSMYQPDLEIVVNPKDVFK
jgi:hypothetical protein